MNSSELTAKKLIDQFVAALANVPGVSASVSDPSGGNPLAVAHGADALVHISCKGKELYALAEAKRSGYPRDIHRPMQRLREESAALGQRTGSEVVPVFVVEAMSPGARDLLTAEEFGYFDSGGSLHLPAAGLYLHVDRPAPKLEKRSSRSLFSAARAQVAHALLLHPSPFYSVQEIAALAQVSPATASQTLDELERHDWVAAKGKGPHKVRQLHSPASLLDAWVRAHANERPPAVERFFVPVHRGERILPQFASLAEQHGVDYEISFEVAAELFAKHLTSDGPLRVRTRGGNLTGVLDALGAQSVQKGANFALIDGSQRGDLAFRQRVGDLYVASPVRIYLDLMQSDGRGPDLAAHFRQEILRY